MGKILKNGEDFSEDDMLPLKSGSSYSSTYITARYTDTHTESNEYIIPEDGVYYLSMRFFPQSTMSNATMFQIMRNGSMIATQSTTSTSGTMYQNDTTYLGYFTAGQVINPRIWTSSEDIEVSITLYVYRLR